MNPEERMDERRAADLPLVISVNDQPLNLEIAKRIRQSDKAAGMVLIDTKTHVAVPRDTLRQLRGLLWYGWHEMNAIRARSGVPLDFDGRQQGIAEGYWSDVVDAMQSALGNDAQPWPSTDAKAIILTAAQEATPDD